MRDRDGGVCTDLHQHRDRLLVERLRQGSGHVPVRGVFCCDGIERYATHEREYGCVQRTGGRGSVGERRPADALSEARDGNGRSGVCTVCGQQPSRSPARGGDQRRFSTAP